MRLAINRPDNPQTTIGGPYEVMKAHGFTINDIEKWGGSFVLGNAATGLDAIKDGKADMFMNARNLGDATVKDIASKRPLLWIDGDPAKIDQAAKVFNFTRRHGAEGHLSVHGQGLPDGAPMGLAARRRARVRGDGLQVCQGRCGREEAVTRSAAR